jgi:hypothetical protein
MLNLFVEASILVLILHDVRAGRHACNPALLAGIAQSSPQLGFPKIVPQRPIAGS